MWGKVIVISLYPGLIVDINECLENENTCGSNGVCNNTIGSYHCVCVAGYRQVGHYCYGKFADKQYVFCNVMPLG